MGIKEIKNEFGINWNKYKVDGEFISHSGLKLPYKWEFELLEKPENKKDAVTICKEIIGLTNRLQFYIVAIISVHPSFLKEYNNVITFNSTTNYLSSQFLTINKDYDYIIYDDVITSGNSIRQCANAVGRKPDFVVCLISRLKETNNKLEYPILELSKSI